MVANVRHLTTGYISPQFHVVFDNLFETVNRTGVDEQAVESICNGLFQRNRELYAEDELDEVGNLIYQPPPLHEVWTGFDPSWSSLCRLGFFSGTSLRTRRLVPIFYGNLRPAGAQTVWLLHFMLQLTILNKKISLSTIP
jgi:hypothetical protein